jgi:hypothetical protein
LRSHLLEYRGPDGSAPIDRCARFWYLYVNMVKKYRAARQSAIIIGIQGRTSKPPAPPAFRSAKAYDAVLTA